MKEKSTEILQRVLDGLVKKNNQKPWAIKSRHDIRQELLERAFGANP